MDHKKESWPIRFSSRHLGPLSLDLDAAKAAVKDWKWSETLEWPADWTEEDILRQRLAWAIIEALKAR